jgi:hypothetical protein
MALGGEEMQHCDHIGATLRASITMVAGSNETASRRMRIPIWTFCEREPQWLECSSQKAIFRNRTGSRSGSWPPFHRCSATGTVCCLKEEDNPQQFERSESEF